MYNFHIYELSIVLIRTSKCEEKTFKTFCIFYQYNNVLLPITPRKKI